MVGPIVCASRFNLRQPASPPAITYRDDITQLLLRRCSSALLCFCGFSQRAKRARQLGQLVVGIQPTWIRQHPEPRWSKTIWLPANCRCRPPERDAVSADSDDSDPTGMIASGLSREPGTAANQLVGRQLVGARGGSRHEIGDAAATCQQFRFFPRRQHPIGEACRVERAPEPVSGPREVVTSCGRVEPRIDAAKQNGEIWRDQVWDSSVDCRRELSASRTMALAT